MRTPASLMNGSESTSTPSISKMTPCKGGQTEWLDTVLPPLRVLGALGYVSEEDNRADAFRPSICGSRLKDGVLGGGPNQNHRTTIPAYTHLTAPSCQRLF